jgi:hypothetical protein
MGGGLTAADRARREQVRLAAAEMFEAGPATARCKLSETQVAELEAVLDAGLAACGARGPAMDAGAGRRPDVSGSGWSTRWPEWTCC